MDMNFLITGSTGNIGGQLVLDILENHPRSTIELLIRGESEAECRGRLVANLQSLEPGFDFAPVSNRISISCSDITARNLGLRKSQYKHLVRSVTHVIHSAASTKFQLPLDHARLTNCHGTERVLKLVKEAYQDGQLKNFAYISTAYVCGDREGYIEDRFYPTVESFSNPYEQSKHEAEKLVISGLSAHPFTIFRPSIVVGNSRTGRIGSFNAMYTPLKCICKGMLKSLPCEPDTPLDIVPLDYVSKAVVSMFLRMKPGAQSIHHITSGERTTPSVQEIVSKTIDHFRRLNSDSPELMVNYKPIRSTDGGNHPPRKRLGLANKIISAYAPYIGRRRVFSSGRTEYILRQLGIIKPKFSDYFPTVIDYWLKSEMIPVADRAA